MILLALAVLLTVLLVAAWRRLEYVGYLKMGEEYERQAALRLPRSATMVRDEESP